MSRTHPPGGVPEWLKGPVSKTGVPHRGTEGSNPSSSADIHRAGALPPRLFVARSPRTRLPGGSTSSLASLGPSWHNGLGPPRWRNVWPSRGTLALPALLLDGKALAQRLRDELAAEVARFREETGVVPGLSVVLVGT